MDKVTRSEQYIIEYNLKNFFRDSRIKIKYDHHAKDNL